MNIIEKVKEILLNFPDIAQLCPEIHTDYTEEKPVNYGLYPTGDMLLKEDILGNQTREHTFALQAVYSSINDYERMMNNAVILKLQAYLESYEGEDEVTIEIGHKDKTGTLTGFTCSNGMLYKVPDGNMNGTVQYQLQIKARYQIND